VLGLNVSVLDQLAWAFSFLLGWYLQLQPFCPSLLAWHGLVGTCLSYVDYLGVSLET